MLIVHLGPKEKVGLPRIEASGSLFDLIHDLLTVTRAMHKQMSSADAGAAKAFREAVTIAINDDDFWNSEVRGIDMAIVKPPKEDE